MLAWHKTNIVHIMLAALVAITAYNLYTFGVDNLHAIIVLVATAAILDMAIVYLKEKKPFVPKNAIISGLILGVIIQGNILFLVLVAAAAILSKHIIKVRGRHIFNPANFGLFLALVLFPVSQSWWGTSNLLLVAVLGLIMVWKLKRFHLALPFLAAHAVLMFFALGDAGQLASHFASGSLLFFIFYMLIEPITSPVSMKSRTAFGALAGVFAAVLYVIWPPAMLVGALFFADLLVPLLNRQKEKPAMPKPEHRLRSEPLTNPNW